MLLFNPPTGNSQELRVHARHDDWHRCAAKTTNSHGISSCGNAARIDIRRSLCGASYDACVDVSTFRKWVRIMKDGNPTEKGVHDQACKASIWKGVRPEKVVVLIKLGLA